MKIECLQMPDGLYKAGVGEVWAVGMTREEAIANAQRAFQNMRHDLDEFENMCHAKDQTAVLQEQELITKAKAVLIAQDHLYEIDTSKLRMPLEARAKNLIQMDLAQIELRLAVAAYQEHLLK
jgi:hypothetical protein